MKAIKICKDPSFFNRSAQFKLTLSRMAHLLEGLSKLHDELEPENFGVWVRMGPHSRRSLVHDDIGWQL